MEWVLSALKGVDLEAEKQDQAEQEVDPQTTEAESAEAPANKERNERTLRIAKELLTKEWGYSPSGLQEWLVEYENCTEEEAAYAVENCGGDWTEQALLKAKDLLDMEDYGWGPTELEKSLVESYGFTAAQAAYAMDHVDPDWREQALKCAKYYADGFGFSYSNMYHTMMMNHGFTEEDAQYAVDNCGADWNQAAVDHVAIFLEYSDEPYTREKMIQEMVEIYGFTEEQAIYGVDQNGLK